MEQQRSLPSSSSSEVMDLLEALAALAETKLKLQLARNKKAVFSWANRSFGVLCCPSPPGPAVPPCAAPYRRTHGMSGI